MKYEGIVGARNVEAGLSASSTTVWVLGFAALTAIGAQIEVPNYPVPFTLQTLFVLLAGSLLGPRLGALSMGAYLFAGVLGMPVFSSGGFGLAKILGPTGGYLLAFPVAAFVIGSIISDRPSFIRILTAHVAGLILIFSFGTFHLWVTYFHDFGQAFSSGFLLFSVWDLLKVAASTGLAYSLLRKRTRQS